MVKEEDWKSIPLFKGFYLGSNFGRVWSCPRLDSLGRPQGGRILKATVNGNGYYMVDLYGKGFNKLRTIHSIVAQLFVRGYGDGLVVNHLDEDKLNNHHANLEWCTPLQNTQHSYDRYCVAIVKARAKHFLVDYPCGKRALVYNMAEFSRKNNLAQGNMIQVAKGTRTHHKGFKCSYIEEQ